MTNDFAAAMRRAVLSTRAYDVVVATRIIKDALARQAGVGTCHTPRPASRKPKSRPALRLIDPKAEIIEPYKVTKPSTASLSGWQRSLQRLHKPLGEVLQILRAGRLSAGAIGSLTGLESLRTKPRCPPPPIADGAQFVTRSFAGAAGTRSYKLYIPACAPDSPRGVIVMLHGCKQNPDDFATGTAMNAVAEAVSRAPSCPNSSSIIVTCS